MNKMVYTNCEAIHSKTELKIRLKQNKMCVCMRHLVALKVFVALPRKVLLKTTDTVKF